MNQPKDLVIVNGPTTPALESLYWRSGAGQSIIYSIQLANGCIVTSPDGFPPIKEEPEQAP